MTALESKSEIVRDLTFGIYDVLTDHRHCSADVVIIPAREDGEPDWDKADPANVEALPADEWPDDEQTARRACVMVSNVDGCDWEATFIVRLDGGKPNLIQIHGPESDRAVAEQIIARDIGAEPIVRPKSALVESMGTLAERVAGKSDDQAAFDRLMPYAEAYGGEIRGESGRATLFGATDGKDRGQIFFADSGQAWLYTSHGARPINLPEKKPDAVKIIDPADWDGRAVPERHWYIDGMIPGRQVTLLSGDGGTGKSLLAYQVGIAGALGVDTIGLSPAQGRVLYLAAEDDEDELQRRGNDILTAMGRTFADLKGKMRVMPMAGMDAELMFLNAERLLQLSDLAQKVEETVEEFRPELLILDTSADVFGGDEINRRQVRSFVSMLRRIAIKHDLAVLLLSHPSVAGMQTGTGLSGSTAWNNSVRSRLYLTADKDDDDLRTLKGMKANYARKGGEMKLRWHEGAFILDDGKPSPGAAIVANNADKVFLRLLSAINGSGRRVSSSKSSAYAPTVMAAMPEREGVSKKSLIDAMARLFAEKKIAVVKEGPPSKQRERLVVVEDEIRQKRMTPDQDSNHVPTDFQPLPTGLPSNPLIPPVGLEHPTRLEGPGLEIQPPANDNVALEENAAPTTIQEAA